MKCLNAIASSLAIWLTSDVGFSQSSGSALFLKGRDQLRHVDSCECRGEYLPPIPEPRKSWLFRIVFDGSSYRTEVDYPNASESVTHVTTVYDGQRFQIHSNSIMENTLSSGASPPASYHYQLPSPFDLQYAWSAQPLSQLKTDDKLWTTSELMHEDGEVTIRGIRCMKVHIDRSDGVTVTRWLSVDHQGVPVMTLATDNDGKVLKRTEVKEFINVDFDGALLLVPTHVTGEMTHTYEMKVFPNSVRVNKPISASEFDIADVNVEEMYDWDTGDRLNVLSGRSFDKDMNETHSPSPVEPVSHLRLAFIATNCAGLLVLFFVWLRRRLCSKRSQIEI